MAAAFLHDLVFDMNGLGHGADRTCNIECTAPAHIDIDQDGQIGDIGDAFQTGLLVIPRSGMPREPAATPPPEMYRDSKPEG